MKEIVDKEINVSEEAVMNKIYHVRGQKVMLDKDLAILYGVKPRRLREQVKRNHDRFPESFMFQLTKKEAEQMVSQNATPSLKYLGGHLPYAFSEHGVLMLSNVLRSAQAVKMSIRIIEVFVKLRGSLLAYKDIIIKINEMESKIGSNEEAIQRILGYLRQFVEERQKPLAPIGFRTEEPKK